MDELFPITPVNFFALSADCFYLAPEQGFRGTKGKRVDAYVLPQTGILCHEETFASVAMGWNEEGLEFLVHVDKPCEQVYYPAVEKGDSIELFIDTRDVKTSGYNTRFCHHFFFLPELAEGHQAGEMTRFRTEDAHPLCDASELHIQGKSGRQSYEVYCRIPKTCLAGYEPAQFDRLGFSYRINRPHGLPQHFSVVSEDYKIEEQPSLWSSMRLIR